MKKIFKTFPAFLFIFLFSVVFYAQPKLSDQEVNYKLIASREIVPNREVSAEKITRPRIVVLKTEAAPEPKADAVIATFSLEKQAFELLNAKRLEQGLEALKWSDEVAKIARLHSQNMANYKFFSHTGLDGLMVNDRADRLGVSKWRAIGENIAYNRGYRNPVEFAVERWMLSTSHKHNLLDDRWKESGVGVAIGADGSYYFTQVFLLRK